MSADAASARADGVGLTPESARRIFLTLTFTRWLPVGLVAGIFVLWALDRGLSIAQATTAMAVTGFVVFLLELPTAGIADTIGRRPVVIASAITYVAAAFTYLVASDLLTFVIAGAVMGIFRALESGPLEAWFVDAVHATRPGADVEDSLSAASTILGLTIAGASLVSGLLVAWHPIESQSALWLPMVIFFALTLVHLAAVVLLMKADAASRPPAEGVRRSLGQVPGVVRLGLGMVRRNPVLRGLLAAEFAWAIALVVLESFNPIRLAELLGSTTRAGVWMGPVTAGGWAVFAAGSWMAGRASRRLGVARTAIIGRALNALGAAVMGLAVDPVTLVVLFALAYAMHGWTGPMHMALLHREATGANRATVLSLNSMVFFAAFTIAAPPLGLLAERASTPLAMVVAGLVSLLGVAAYLPARRAELARAGARPPVQAKTEFT